MAVALTVLAAVFPGPGIRPERHRVEAPDRRVAVVRPYRAKLMRMAGCESTWRWHLANGNGFYGGLQFDKPTWNGVGGRGYPHEASRLEQMYRAVLLIRRRGFAPWPRCGSA